MSNVYRDQVVEVQAAPLFDFCSACGAEESPAHLCTTTAEKNGGKLLPEAPLPVFKKLIRLVHNEPLHTETQQERKGQSDSRLIRFYIRTKNKELLPAEVNSRRVLFKKENQPVGGADENIYKHKICTVRTQLIILRLLTPFYTWTHLWLLPYFLFEWGPYFLAAKEALSIM